MGGRIMKNYVFLIFLAFLLIPLGVNAEVKEIGDYKYTIESKTYKDYVCDEIEGKQYRFFTNLDNTKVVLSVVNESPAYDYLIDFTKTNNCTPMTEKESEEFFDEDLYEYFWGKDNVIRKVKMVTDSERLFILTEDTTVDNNKAYFSLTDLTFTEIENPKDSELNTYYEEIFLKMENEYDKDAHYYQFNNDGSVTYVGQITEEKFNDGEFYYTKLTNLHKEDVLTLNNTKFIVPKEAGIFGEDYKYDRSDYLDVISVAGKSYLIFAEENLGDPVVFDLGGNIVTFGLNKIMSPQILESTKNDMIALVIGPSYADSKMYVMDEEFNKIYEENADDYFIRYLTSVGNTDYFAIDSYVDTNYDKKILEITKSKKENITLSGKEDSSLENPKTGDNIKINIIMAIISLIGLVGIMMYLKKKKTVNDN